MRIEEVKTNDQKKEFLIMPVRLYQHEPCWIRPLNQDIEAVFDPEKNKYYKQGDCIRWLLRNDSNEVIGRVAAFINKKTVNKGNDQPTGGMGFFECINDQRAAFMLFDACKQWLQERGMEAMDGPINFGDRDRWWGLLVEGFDREPNYQCNYQHPYYKTFFEAYGFQVFFYQLTFGRKVVGPLTERLQIKADLIAKDPNYSFRYLRKSEMHRLPELMRNVYNRAWANRGEIPEMTEAQAKHIVKQMKFIVDEKLLWFGFYKDDPVVCFLSLPEVNQIFKHVNGNLNWFGKILFLYHKLRGTSRKAFGVLFGVVPEHQGKGVDGAIIMAFRQLMQDEYHRYDEYELNWIGDFNPKMINVVEQINVEVVKKHATYRKLFDETKPFKRAPILK
jgi:hypothetical protein